LLAKDVFSLQDLHIPLSPVERLQLSADERLRIVVRRLVAVPFRIFATAFVPLPDLPLAGTLL